MSEPATTYVSLTEKEIRSIIVRRAQDVALAARGIADAEKLHDLNRDLLISILNLGDLEKRSLKTTGDLIDDEIPAE